MAEQKEHTLGSLFSDLTKELRALLRQEMELARVETTQKLARLLKDLAMIGGGGFVMLIGLMVLIAALILILGIFIPLWLSALLFGIILLLVGGILLLSGKKDLKASGLTPERTAESLKETAQWAKTQMK